MTVFVLPRLLYSFQNVNNRLIYVMSLNKEKSIFAGEMWEQTVDGLPAPVILPP